MANYQDILCKDCPYQYQRHLKSTPYFNQNGFPLSIDFGNDADILIVLQAPGEEEWIVGKPLQSTVKIGGTAGRRVELSWKRVGKKRFDFDITNSVQCFPGKEGKRDNPPVSTAVIKCYEWLKYDILNKSYRKIIVFGDIAETQVKKALKDLGKITPIITAPHPNGGVTRSHLDSLWD